MTDRSYKRSVTVWRQNKTKVKKEKYKKISSDTLSI